MDEKDHPRGNFFLDCIGKVKKGVSIEQARAELEAITARIAVQHPETNSGSERARDAVSRREWSGTSRRSRCSSWARCFSCISSPAPTSRISSWRAAPPEPRKSEFVWRLGASRRQIVRQLLAESLVLGMVGSALGLLFAVWGVDLMLTALPNEVPYWIHFDFDWRVFSFALGIGAVSSRSLWIVAGAPGLASPSGRRPQGRRPHRRRRRERSADAQFARRRGSGAGPGFVDRRRTHDAELHESAENRHRDGSFAAR